MLIYFSMCVLHFQFFFKPKNLISVTIVYHVYVRVLSYFSSYIHHEKLCKMHLRYILSGLPWKI